MKKAVFTAVIVIVSLFKCVVADAQCATNAYISNGGNCISLVWFPAAKIPAPLPVSLVFEENVYTLASGLGDLAFPAVYKKTALDCELPSDYVDGNVTINLTSEPITCKYPEGTLLALADIDLKASKSGSKNLLSWKVSSPDVRLLEVERSTDARNFESIKTVSAENNIQLVKQGSYSDGTFSSRAFYRIRITATNNRITYSKIVEINDATTQTPLVSPNPARGNFVVSGINVTNPSQVSITDASGRKLGFKVLRFDAASKTMQIAMEKSLGGIVFINCNNAEKQVLKALLQ